MIVSCETLSRIIHRYTLRAKCLALDRDLDVPDFASRPAQILESSCTITGKDVEFE